MFSLTQTELGHPETMEVTSPQPQTQEETATMTYLPSTSEPDFGFAVWAQWR